MIRYVGNVKPCRHLEARLAVSIPLTIFRRHLYISPGRNLICKDIFIEVDPLATAQFYYRNVH